VLVIWYTVSLDATYKTTIHTTQLNKRPCFSKQELSVRAGYMVHCFLGYNIQNNQTHNTTQQNTTTDVRGRVSPLVLPLLVPLVLPLVAPLVLPVFAPVFALAFGNRNYLFVLLIWYTVSWDTTYKTTKHTTQDNKTPRRTYKGTDTNCLTDL
jgi:hypothetical protein